MFAAASDDLLAVNRGHSIMCFDAVAALGQTPETELILIEVPADHRAKVGQHTLWQCLKVRESRWKRARAWQDHFVDILLSKECPGTFKQGLKSSSEFETAVGLHVDDGYMTGTAVSLKKVFAYLKTKLVLNFSPIISLGSSFEHVKALSVIAEEGLWVRDCTGANCPCCR